MSDKPKLKTGSIGKILNNMSVCAIRDQEALAEVFVLNDEIQNKTAYNDERK